MKFEYDNMFYKYMGIKKEDLYYEVHLSQLDEGFFYDVYFDEMLDNEKYEKITNLINNFEKNYNYNGDNYAGYIGINKEDSILHIYLDIGNVLPENQIISAQEILKILNQIEGIQKVIINDFEIDYGDEESDDFDENPIEEYLNVIHSKIEKIMYENGFIAKLNENHIEYVRVLNKQIYQVITINFWRYEIELNGCFFYVGIKIIPICTPNIEGGIIRDLIDINNIIHNSDINFNVVDYTLSNENVDKITHLITVNLLAELNLINSYKQLYRKVISKEGYIDNVYSSETLLWLFFACDENFEQYDRCVELAKSTRLSGENEAKYNSNIKNRIPFLKSIEDLFKNYKIDELNEILKQTEERNLKKLCKNVQKQ